MVMGCGWMPWAESVPVSSAVPSAVVKMRSAIPEINGFVMPAMLSGTHGCRKFELLRMAANRNYMNLMPFSPMIVNIDVVRDQWGDG